jgi:hypothetical protein
MGYVLGAVVLLLVVGGILHLVSGGDRYARMTEAEFEEEAKRGSALGSAMLEVQKVVDPRNKVEYLQQRDKHVEADGAESADKPS